MDYRKFTPTQMRIITELSDGKAHLRDDLVKLLNDDMSLNSLYVNISKIREVLRPHGEDIICESFRRRTHYRHVRLLCNPNT